MLYQGYQAFTDTLAPARWLAGEALRWRDAHGGALARLDWPRRLFALADVFVQARITHEAPPFGISMVHCGNSAQPVVEEVAVDAPFGRLIHFAKPEITTPQPRMLVVAPLSGHYATLLRHTVEVLLRDHDVYITDWKNARDVPASAGRFGLSEYIDYVIAFLRHLGEGAHLLAVCQPCVPALAAVAIMAQDNDPCQPHTMTLMGGPIDVRAAPTVVNELAMSHSIDWFADNLISSVPWRYQGAGRRVYPGFLQLSAFMAMNLGRHFGQFRKLYQHLAQGEDADARKISDFYEEYFAVLDLTAEFYLETVEEIFQKAALATGELLHHGRRVDPSAIRRTALLTVEGERDDICSVGQTLAAHDLCSSLRPYRKRHHMQAGVGHYGVFSGKKWDAQIYPLVRNAILSSE